MSDVLEDFKVDIINMFKGLKETMIKEVNHDMVTMSHKREYNNKEKVWIRTKWNYEIAKYINWKILKSH